MKQTNVRFDTTVETIRHPSGLTIVLCEKPDFKGAYAMMSANFGSNDNRFLLDGREYTLPDGIAHFLEHKLFQNEDGVDALELFAKTGANANAYTSNDKTSYLFLSTDRFCENLEILLGFVTHPFFSDASVQKERGIIEQEIAMYRDDPTWQGLLGALGAMYHTHPLGIDVAGSPESIAKVTPDLLYTCHRAFYRLENMVLTVAGNFDRGEVLAVCDKLLTSQPPVTVERLPVTEPQTVATPYYEEEMDISIDNFYLGFKLVPRSEKENNLDAVLLEMLCDIVAGEASPLYRRLYDNGTINDSFTDTVMGGRDYLCALFGGETTDSTAVKTALCDEIVRLQQDGIDSAAFHAAKNAMYGRYVRLFDSLSGLADMLSYCAMVGVSLFDVTDRIATVTLEDMQTLLARLSPENCALSVIRQKGE